MLDKLKKWRHYRKFAAAAAAAGAAAVYGWWPDHHLDADEIAYVITAGFGAIGVVVLPNKPQPPAAQ